MVMTAGTVGTDAFHHIVDGGLLVAFGQADLWDRCVAEAECTLALLAVEVYMYVFILIRIMAQAQFVPRYVAAVLELVYQMVVLEQEQRAEDARLVNRQDHCCQLLHGDRIVQCRQCPCDEDAVGSHSDVVCPQ